MIILSIQIYQSEDIHQTMVAPPLQGYLEGAFVIFTNGPFFKKISSLSVIYEGLFFWTLLCFSVIGLYIPTYCHVMCLQKLGVEYASLPHGLWAWSRGILGPMVYQEYVTPVMSNQELYTIWLGPFHPHLHHKNRSFQIMNFGLGCRMKKHISWVELIWPITPMKHG